jgi:serine/threonine protein kinase/N-acetylneuraminic acid mutarotase
MSTSNLIGRTIGQYRVVEQLGMGGMATVYKAYHPAMERYVALKIPPEYLTRDPNFRARFIREARTLARLEHPHILPVYDFGEEDGLPYMVMRYVDGGTLRELMAKGPLPLDQALRLVREVAEALGYAHRQGVTHRDVKPANVLLDRNGAALLTDFGIAKILDENTELTGAGVALGTPQYMAPEQVQGKPVDARTDIYSLGVVLYEVTTGRRPFAAETPLALAMMHVSESLPLPRQVNPAVPDAVERIILRAMAKDPADRFQTAEELATALQLLSTEPRPAMDPTVSLPAALGEGTLVAPVVPVETGKQPIGPGQSGEPVFEDGTIAQPASPETAPPKRPVEPPPIPSPNPQRSRRMIVLGVGALAVVAIVGLATFALLARAPSAGPATATPAVVLASPTRPTSPSAVNAVALSPVEASPLPSPTLTPDRGAAGGTPAPNTWSARQPMPGTRTNFGAATGSDGRIYAVGGQRGSRALDTVEAYTPGTNRWATVAPMPTARYGLAVVAGPDGRIYAIGGHNSTDLSTVEAYSPKTNNWTTVASLPTARQDLAAVSGPDGRIYAIGGLKGDSPVGAVEVYTPATNTWATVASLPTARSALAAVAGSDGRIYAIGGGPESTAAVEAYTPGTNSWTSVASMPAARSFLAAVSGADGRIYAIGGTNGNPLRSTEAYTPGTNRWSAAAALPVPRSGLAASADLDGRIYVMGGRDTSGPLAGVDVYEPTRTVAAISASPTATP